jgi:lipopolysaccharide/colanic/teichoic acid biosynthesis glycosyltransferase
MSIVPLLLDYRAPHTGGTHDGGSLLLLPVGQELLLQELVRNIASATAHRGIVVAAFPPDDAYEARVRVAYPNLDRVVYAPDFQATIDRYAPSDSFLIVSPNCYPVAGLDVRELCEVNANDARMVRHLVAFEAPTSRTKELVQTDDDGHVRRIQRYFAPMTWPFPTGVLASLVPVACAQIVAPVTLASLEELRTQLSASGIPNQDVPFHGDTFDLGDEAGVLALNEFRVYAASSAIDDSRGRLTPLGSIVSPLATVHSSARLVGPVIVAAGAEVSAGALVIGPATIGEEAHIGRDAVVAQCLVLPRAEIAPGTTVRHRVISGHAQHVVASSNQRRHTAPHLIEIVEPSNRAIPTYVAVKAVFEPIVAAAALLVLSPLLAVMAVLVRLTSPGPVFYGDEREGKDAVPFKCWKFRTMFSNANELQRMLAEQQQMDGPQFKMDHDPRVTKVGSWLRRLNVDELPQLWNVVRGEMSLVGPRPSPFRENQICVPWRNGRLSVRPGITGLWQVCRKDRASGDFHQWIHYDLLYVRNVSFRLDTMIGFATIFTLGGRKPVPLRLMLGRKPRARPPELPASRPLAPLRAQATDRITEGVAG